MIAVVTNEDNSCCVVRVDGELTIEHAAEFSEAISAAMEGGLPVTIDLGEVHKADLTCLQLLCSACMTSYMRNKPITISGLSGRIVTTVENGGLTRYPDTGDECFWLSGGYHG